MRIVIKGDFTKDELREILQKVRDVEQRNKENLVTTYVETNKMTREELEEVVGGLSPPGIHRVSWKKGEKPELERAVEAMK